MEMEGLVGWLRDGWNVCNVRACGPERCAEDGGGGDLFGDIE